MYEKEDLVDALLVDNSARRRRQKKLDIRVIVGNPPYSIGQGSQNDNNQNVAYPHLDHRIETTYAAQSSATLSKGLYDSYIRAIRWASDRIGTSGVVSFVTNAGWLNANTTDGLRKCLVKEFSSIYVFHLRGDQRTQGEMSRKEGGKIFGSGSRTPIAISVLVKNPNAAEHGKIYFHDIGDYLSREEKLAKVEELASLDGITHTESWQTITPDEHGDWLRQRDDGFAEFIVLGHKEKTNEPKIFENYSLGIGTNRDSWCYNFSHAALSENMSRMIAFFNAESARFDSAYSSHSAKSKSDLVTEFINSDPKQISWSVNLKQDIARGKQANFIQAALTRSLYRPFTKEWLYFDRTFNERVLQMPRIFPDAEKINLVICVSGVGARSFSSLISNHLPCLDNIEKGQCFPLYLYESKDEKESANAELFVTAPAIKYTRRDAITTEGLQHFQSAYPGETISKEDIFYYVYGLLHSPDYRDRYADNLSKELPRIPCVKTTADFWAFSKAGRKLADLHLNYETVTPYAATIEGEGKDKPEVAYRVEKMKHGKGQDKDKDLSVIHYNGRITVRDIPLEAYDYIVNGKSAIAWVMERQAVKTDKDSGITNDANAWATETMNDPRYPLDLLLRVITVSLETMKVVKVLPALAI